MRYRDSKRTIILPVRLSHDEYRVLAQLARRDDRSRCAMLRRLVAEAWARAGRQDEERVEP